MHIHHQSVFEKWPLEDKSVQAVITSPPYWGLRKYDIPDIIIGGDKDCKHKWGKEGFLRKRGSIGNSALEGGKTNQQSAGVGHPTGSFCLCGAWMGQYGLEASFKDYIEHTLLWAKEAWRVLRDDGVFFLNIGDSYNSHTAYAKTCGGIIKKQIEKDSRALEKIPERHSQKAPDKCKLLIPHRVAIALINEGWALRNDIIWSKPNAMPESCGDRFSKKFEYVFMLTKQSKYFFDSDAVKTPIKTWDYDKRDNAPNRAREKGYTTKINKAHAELYGSPRARVHRMPPIRGKKQTAEVGGIYSGNEPKITTTCNPGDVWSIPTQPSSEKHFAMWPEKLVERMVRCSTKKGDTVLDPFCGSGTTLKVAEELDRKGLGIDLGYKDVQSRRLSQIQKRLLD